MELVVAISIVGVLVSLLLPSVQMAREFARRTQCSSNLREAGTAIHHFESAFHCLPVGSERLAGTEHAWSLRILPFLEQSKLYLQFDLTKPWDDSGGNVQASRAKLSIYRCPSAVLEFPGKQDYGGVFGTTLTNLPLGVGPDEAFGSGAMLVTSQKQDTAIWLNSVTDGLSTTLCIAESVDRNSIAAGRWACGLNCFAQAESLNVHNSQGDMESKHGSGVPVAFADGHVEFLSLNIDNQVLGALCTRNGCEFNADASN